uniref:Protein kinase domain-containing protein n=1 Tax=Strongyloides papillosus TaxID=174720 RepID=A0A0N5BWI7_STREA
MAAILCHQHQLSSNQCKPELFINKHTNSTSSFGESEDEIKYYDNKSKNHKIVFRYSRRNSAFSLANNLNVTDTNKTHNLCYKNLRKEFNTKKRLGKSLDRNNNDHVKQSQLKETKSKFTSSFANSFFDPSVYFSSLVSNSVTSSKEDISENLSKIANKSNLSKTQSTKNILTKSRIPTFGSDNCSFNTIINNEGIVIKTSFITPIRSKYDLKDHYELHQKIGSGNFSEVFLLSLKSDNKIQKQEMSKRDNYQNKCFALKEISKAKMEGKNFFVENEVHILSNFKHPNICNLIEAFSTKSTYLLVFELASKGDLFDAIKKLGHLSEPTVSSITFQLTCALAYLHSNNIVHRDVKPENILLNSDLTVKLTDFGLACYVPKKTYLSRICGTMSYVSPEVIMGKYGIECDIWSLGVVFHIMLVGHAPFRSQNKQKLFKLISKAQFSMEHRSWNLISREARNLVLRLLTLDVNQRIKANEILTHPFIQKKF